MSDTPHASAEALQKQVEQLTLEKQQLISLVSHDLRSPLNRAFALAELLLMDQDTLSDFQKDYLGKMKVVIADGLSMMRNLVDYRNLEFRSIDLLVEPVNVGDFVGKLIQEFKPTTDKKEITVSASLPNNLVISSDKQCLDRVIGNLFSNAVKFSKPGKKISVRAFQKEEWVCVEIEDEIGGFSPHEEQTLFQKFIKYKAQPTGNESSTGLGMFVSKAMAERINGNVVCKTQEGAGSTFVITLPSKIN
jgi:signal transduction histidine kinase